jgi:hypothetical protein
MGTGIPIVCDSVSICHEDDLHDFGVPSMSTRFEIGVSKIYKTGRSSASPSS